MQPVSLDNSGRNVASTYRNNTSATCISSPSTSSFTGMSSPSNDKDGAGTSSPSISGLSISVKPGTSSRRCN